MRASTGPARYALRLLVAVTYVGALVLALQLAGVGGVTDEPAQAEPAVEVTTTAAAPPPRPESAPARIPEWAWGMHRWHDDRHGNVRPLDAPLTMPAWYWEWRAWRKAFSP